MPHQRDALAGAHRQVKVLDHGGVAIGVVKGHILKAEIALDVLDDLFAFVMLQVGRFEHLAGRADRFKALADGRDQVDQPHHGVGERAEIAAEHDHLAGGDGQKPGIGGPGRRYQAQDVEEVVGDPRHRAEQGVAGVELQPGLAHLGEGFVHVGQFVALQAVSARDGDEVGHLVDSRGHAFDLAAEGLVARGQRAAHGLHQRGRDGHHHQKEG